LIRSDSSNLNVKGPLERTTTGSLLTSLTSPGYAIDYGFKKSIIHFHTPTSDSETVFSNYFDSVTFDTVTLKNLTFYSPGSSTAVFCKFPTSLTDVTVKSFSIDGVDLTLNSNSIFDFRNKGTLTVTNITATNLETNSYGYSQTDYAYVSTVGPLFSFVAFEKDSSLSTLTYTIVRTFMIHRATFN
jgi:hypothetical protein